MILDGRQIRPGTLPSYDVVIVGTGAAGQTLLRRLSGTDLRVAIVESGGEGPSAEQARLKDVETPRYGIRASSRERYLGGSLNTWGFGCVPLDPIDFERRPWVEHSGWPFPASELDSWYAEARRDLALPRPEEVVPTSTPMDGVLQRRRVRSRFLLYTTRLAGFDPDLRRLLEGSALHDLVLHANVVGIELDPSERSAVGIRARSHGGGALTITGERYVLACGGIENPRLLLMSPTRDGRGVGNRFDVVGRYFMEHPKEVCGAIVPERRLFDLAPFQSCTIDGQALRGGFSLTDEEQRARRLLNSHVRILVERTGQDATAAMSRRVRRAFRAARRSRPSTPGTAHASAAAAAPPAAPPDEMTPVVATPPGAIATGRGTARRLPPGFVRVVSAVRRRLFPVRRIWLYNFLEMEPRPDNRVRLSDELDDLGCPKAAVDYEPSELDRRSLRELHHTLAEDLAASGFGTLESPLLTDPDGWTITRDASHHLGGTRMGDDPRTSVVDRDGRVHGVDNLYVAGGSVFPTGGYANPTLTIVALAIRLADHLAARSRSATGRGVDEVPRAA